MRGGTWAALLAVMLLGLLGCGSGNTEVQAPQLTRDQFKAAVYDKTPQEVIAAVGRPDRTSQFQGVNFWEYAKRTYDPVTGQIDPEVKLMFGDGSHVTIVNY